MTGILEAIHADLQIIKAALQNGAAAPAQTAAPAAPAAVDPFAGLGAPAAPAAVTEAQVMALIEPHLDNAAIKTALQGVLGQMGIARLPDARPDQYPEMYQRFAGIIQQFAAQPAQPQSII
jgi:hypothetical protein